MLQAIYNAVGEIMSRGFDTFINADLSKYMDEWICIVDDKIIFHGDGIKKGYKMTEEKYPGKLITIARVPGETNCIFFN